MLYINAKERVGIEVFRLAIYNTLKEKNLRYSDQRERVLKILYTQNYPISIDCLVSKLKENGVTASYTTTLRHLKFFDTLDLLITVQKIPKGYLLKKSIDNDEVEVVNYRFFD
ncbi:MAG: transcriptional repressor [Sulfurimonas sp.]|nr:transcriptional repressor [Sulfurimonas sp.]